MISSRIPLLRLLGALVILLTFSAYASSDCDRKAVRISPAEEWLNYSDSAQTAATPRINWWAHLGDPLLDSLIRVGLDNNYDVAMAVRRINIARAQLGQARSAYFPQINLSAGYNYGRQSGAVTSSHGHAVTNGYFDLGLSASWEIDVFGRITEQVKARKANVRVSRAERAGVEVSIQAQICQTYISLRMYQAELAVARGHAESQHKVLDISHARFEAGLASMMDVNQAQDNYYSTAASIPMLESEVNSAISSLGVLLADQSQTLRDRLARPAPMPTYSDVVNVGTPAQLLRRRPDIVQAENTIDMYAAQRGVARCLWLPSVSVQASAGTQAHNGGDLFSKQSFYYSVGPAISWTVFEGLNRKYSNAEATQALRNAVDQYNLTMQTALSEVNDAISAYFANLEYIKNISKACEASHDYNERAVSNYKSGLSPFINVADAQMAYLQNMNSLIQARANALNALVTLYRALGGGWDGDVETDCE